MTCFKSPRPKAPEGMAPPASNSGAEACEVEFKETPVALLEAWKEGVRKTLRQVQDTFGERVDKLKKRGFSMHIQWDEMVQGADMRPLHPIERFRPVCGSNGCEIKMPFKGQGDSDPQLPAEFKRRVKDSFTPLRSFRLRRSMLLSRFLVLKSAPGLCGCPESALGRGDASREGPPDPANGGVDPSAE